MYLYFYFFRYFICNMITFHCTSLLLKRKVFFFYFFSDLNVVSKVSTICKRIFIRVYKILYITLNVLKRIHPIVFELDELHFMDQFTNRTKDAIISSHK